MKKLMLLTAVTLLIFGCKKDEVVYNSDDEPISGNLEVSVFQMKKLSTGEEYKEAVSFLKDFIVWEAEGKDFEIKNIDDLDQGFAYDKRSKKSYKYFKKSGQRDWDKKIKERVVYKDIVGLKPGRYFVFIRVSPLFSEGLSNAWSYTTIEVKPGENKIEKVFPSSAKSYQYSPW